MAAVLTSQHPSIRRLSHLVITNLSPRVDLNHFLSMTADQFILDGFISADEHLMPIKGFDAG